MDGLYILGFFAFISLIVGAGFIAFGINESKINKIFKLNEE
jgi:hypothetical protein